MREWRSWLLPVVLAAAQLGWWPGLALLRDPPPTGHQVALVVAAAVTVTVLLVRLRDRPVLGTVVVAAVIALVAQALPFTPLLVIGHADLVALFGVAARCSLRTGVALLVLLPAFRAVLVTGREGSYGVYLVDVAVEAGLCVLVVILGRRRHRWTAERAAAARRLAEATQAEREAAAVERRRLARELHDVTAHHLTSIVIHASAASRQPEMRADAARYAARAGRDTLTTLRELVSILPTEDAAAPELADLAAAFRDLGQDIVADLPASPPPPPVARAAYGIAREALTNTLRYAPGRAVRLRLSYPGANAELVVDDDGRGDRPALSGLGGGRGVAGMRERAEAIGGTLDAGRRDDGGWRVRAVLPLAETARRTRVRWARVAVDSMLLLATLTVPPFLFGAYVAGYPGPVPPALAIALLLVAHATPVLWRRHHPWLVLLLVALAVWLFPLSAAAGVYPGWHLLFAFGPEVLAVYSVGAWSTWRWWGWPAVPFAITSWFAAWVVLLAVSSPGEGLRAVVRDVAEYNAYAFLLIALGFPAGVVAGRLRDRRHAAEEGGIAAAMARAAGRARDERTRVAGGLREAVLQHATDVSAAADRADLPAVIAAAREALAAMRALLDGLGHEPAPLPGRHPAGIPARAGIAPETTRTSAHTEVRPSALHPNG